MKTNKELTEYLNKIESINAELLKQLKRALHYYGRGFEPKEDVEETIGSLLYLDIQEAIKKSTERIH